MPVDIGTLTTRGVTLVASHIPCCGVAFGMAATGMAVTHNPTIELALAVGGAIAGDEIGHRIFKAKCCVENGTKSLIKRYGIAACIGVASWGVHQAYFHDHDDEGHTHAEIAEFTLPNSKLKVS